MKLTIAVQKPPEANISLREETSYRWDRIAVTGLGAIALLAVVVWVFWPTGNQQSTEQLALQEGTDLPLFNSESAEPPRPPLQAMTSDLTTPETKPTVAATTDIASNAPSPVDHQDQDEQPRSTQGKLDSTETGQLEEKFSPHSLAHAPSSATRQSAPLAEDAGLFSQLSTTIHSDKIKRFTLARSVRNKEPVGALTDITLSNDNVATVFAYSEAMDLKDETLRYVWTLNGSELAQVKVPVWSSRWRSHSSKYVTHGMRGDWKVELRDSSGELLAMSEFQY